jgi:hypothetical protein
MSTPKFYQSVLQEVEGNIFEHVYPHISSNLFTIKERMGNPEGNCEDCGQNEWILLPKESYAVRVGGKPYIECYNCGHTTHL